MKKTKKGMTLRQREVAAGYSFIGLWLIGAVFIFGRGLFEAIRYSMSTITFGGEAGYSVEFVGADNYNSILLQNATFNRFMVESLLSMFTNAVFIIFFSLFVALLLNRKFRFRGLARMVFFLPVLMASGAVSGALTDMLNMILGGATSTAAAAQQYTASSNAPAGFNADLLFVTLFEFGMPPTIINYIIMAISQVHNIISSSGVQIVIFLAGLQSIPPVLYEVAKIEGASAYETFWKITFPIISPLILTNYVYTIVDEYSNSTVFSLARETAFLNLNFGIASAMSLVTSAIILLILLVSGYAISRYVVYMN